MMCLLACGCQHTKKHWTHNLGKAMDDIALALEEYGSVSMSNPLLQRSDSENFAFNMTVGNADKYYNDARSDIQGSAASLYQSLQRFSLGAALELDPTETAAYADSLQQFFMDRARIQEKNTLVDAAARDDYLAAVHEATKEVDPARRAELIAEAKRNYSNALTGPSTDSPEFPTAPDDGSDVPENQDLAPDASKIPSLPADDKMAAIRGLLRDGSPTISNRSAIITAAGDNAVEAIFKVIGNPEQADSFKDKITLFGVATVSVAPGWRTRKDFAADLSVQAELTYRKPRAEVIKAVIRNKDIPKDVRAKLAMDSGFTPANVSPDLNDIPEAGRDLNSVPKWIRGTDMSQTGSDGFVKKMPLVAAVSPLTDVQALDLSSSYRKRTELALALSIALRTAGMKLGADALEQFVKSRGADALTRTTDIPVTAYSNGSMFGYQIGPVFRGIENPSLIKQKSEYILTRQSFPVLILCGLGQEDLTPFIFLEKGKFSLKEPYLQLSQTHRWLPLDRDAANGNRLSEEKRLKWSLALNAAFDKAEKSLTDIPESQKSIEEKTLYMARVRIDKLKYHAFGARSRQPLPISLILPTVVQLKYPQIKEIIPRDITLKRDKAGNPEPQRKDFIIIGEGLDRIDPKEINFTSSSVKLNGDARPIGGGLLVPVEIRGGDKPFAFLFSLKNQWNVYGPTQFSSDPIAVNTAPKKTPAPAAKSETAKYIKKTATGITEHVVEFSPGIKNDSIQSSEDILIKGIGSK